MHKVDLCYLLMHSLSRLSLKSIIFIYTLHFSSVFFALNVNATFNQFQSIKFFFEHNIQNCDFVRLYLLNVIKMNTWTQTHRSLSSFLVISSSVSLSRETTKMCMKKAHPTPPKKQTHTQHSEQRWALEHDFFVHLLRSSITFHAAYASSILFHARFDPN